MTRRRKPPQPSHSSSERWLITYADLITLLMIFFVIMYAMSKLDVNKYESLAAALQMQFQDGSSIIPKGNGIMGEGAPGVNRPETKPQESAPEPQADRSEPDHLTPGERRQEEQHLQNLLQVVRTYIAEQHLQEQVSVSDTPRGIAITLNDLFLFDLAKADLKQETYPVLEKLSSLLPKLDAKVSIEGHTDDLPLAANSLYQDNWGLSQARSVAVIRYFINNAGLPADMFVSSAFADTRPVAPNDSEANRQQNRRVEIIVLRSQ